MEDMILISGGIKSGKSRQAEKLAQNDGGDITVLVSAYACDEEMQARIEKHRGDRPESWQVIETGDDLKSVLNKIAGKTVIFDCLTLYAARFFKEEKCEVEEKIYNDIEALINWCGRKKVKLIIVTNEIGLGVIPLGEMTRRYIDCLGKLNQRLAEKSDVFYMMFSGRKIKI